MEVTFFSTDFWRQLVAVFVGAFLGFGGALLAEYAIAARRRSTLARMTRQVIVREAIDNLRTLAQMARLAEIMQEESFKVARTSTGRPRAEVLQQFMTAESLAALSENEAKLLMVAPPQLVYLKQQYEDYEQLLRTPKTALAPVSVEGKGIVLYRDMVTDRLLRDIGLAGSNIVGLLSWCCHGAKGTLVDDEGKEVASKLAPVTFGRASNFGRAFSSSMLKGTNIPSAVKYLVVWRHDWPGCPVAVIELDPHLD